MMNNTFKRLMDVLLSGLAIVILSPVLVTAAIAVKLDSEGPVIFRQERRTRDGRIFSMYKFRSMIVNAEKMGSGLFNYENDPRVTKVGRFLRNSSIDELPQLFNIFIGDMSIVGPRPCVKYELGDFDTLNNRYKKRFQVKAGLTGLAQVMGRNDISWDEKVTYDNKYVDEFQKHGVFLDIKIIIQTFMKVLKKENIYEVKQDSSLDDAEAAKKEEEEIIRIAHLPD